GISSHASPPGTGTSPQPRLQEASLATPAARTGIQLIPALTRVPAFIDTEVDSDNAVSRVVASVPAGPWAGAVLYSQDARLAGKGMDIHFDRMMWRGMFLKVNAYALNEHTGMSSVASDVNHRWFKHIVLPSVLGGVGSVGSLYKDANTQVIQGNYGSITGRVGMPDGEALAGVIAGGMAERGSQLLTRQAESEPYRQVTVSRGEVVSILFVEPVMSNDISPPSSGTAPSVPPPSGRPLTQEEAERQASDRIQAAVMRKQNEMRQRYGIQQESHP
ncbi:TPA: conjugal transfer protein TraO, partial [Escherichia coli]|nr:conjugal transfer protein TraO [Escherichia coli]